MTKGHFNLVGLAILATGFLVFPGGGASYAIGRVEVVVVDRDGPAEGMVTCMRWNQRIRGYENVDTAILTQGRSQFRLANGRYILQVLYSGTIPSQSRETEEFEIVEDQVKRLEFYFEKGRIEIESTDREGPAPGSVVFSRLLGGTQIYDRVRMETLRRGRAGLDVPPGIYRVRVQYTKSTPSQSQETVSIVVRDGTNRFISSYFLRGRCEIRMRDYMGHGTGDVVIFQWRADENTFRREGGVRLVNGFAAFDLAPGVYRIRVNYEGTRNIQSREITGIDVIDSDPPPIDLYFPRGSIEVIATDDRGYAQGVVTCMRWNSVQRAFTEVNSSLLSDGRNRLFLGPGVYRIRVEYTGVTPAVTRILEPVVVADRLSRVLSFEFGGNRLMPPRIDAYGPLEVGDGDGYLEVGETAVIRLRIQDINLEMATFSVNGEEAARFSEPGESLHRVALEQPGVLRMELLAKDRSEPPNYASWVGVVPILDRDGGSHPSARQSEDRVIRNLSAMRCPKCGTLYSLDERFCSKDGETLNETTWQASESRGFSYMGPIDDPNEDLIRLLLHRLGIDPNSPNTQKIRNLVEGKFFPFATVEETKDTFDQIEALVRSGDGPG